MANYQFYTDCTNSDAVGSYGECINEMVQSPHCEDIDSHEFMLKIAKQHGFQDGLAEMFGYDSLRAAADDYALSCHRSRFQGQPCFYVRFSGIEHIFVDAQSLQKLVTGDRLSERSMVILSLGDALDYHEPFDNATTPSEVKQALMDFVECHYATFMEHNILLGSLFAYSNNFQDVVREIDNEVFIQPAIIHHQLNVSAYSKHALFHDKESVQQFFEQVRDVVESAFEGESQLQFAERPPFDENTFITCISYTGPLHQGFAEQVEEAIRAGTKGLQWEFLEKLSLQPQVAGEVPAHSPPGAELQSAPTATAIRMR